MLFFWLFAVIFCLDLLQIPFQMKLIKLIMLMSFSNEKDKEMVMPIIRVKLKKQGYNIIGSHSGVKLCIWTKLQLRGCERCYKRSFYGIERHKCMVETESLARANKCSSLRGLDTYPEALLHMVSKVIKIIVTTKDSTDFTKNVCTPSAGTSIEWESIWIRQPRIALLLFDPGGRNYLSDKLDFKHHYLSCPNTLAEDKIGILICNMLFRENMAYWAGRNLKTGKFDETEPLVVSMRWEFCFTEKYLTLTLSWNIPLIDTLISETEIFTFDPGGCWCICEQKDAGTNLTRGRVIPWEGWNDEKYANMEKFIMVEISVAIIDSCVNTLCNNIQSREPLKLFYKMVNGFDPPKYSTASLGSFNVLDSSSSMDALMDELFEWKDGDDVAHPG